MKPSEVFKMIHQTYEWQVEFENFAKTCLQLLGLILYNTLNVIKYEAAYK